ncbi:MAG: energy-coupling factor transporter ATPase [Phascolarctobacterium sp.]|nr:MAG: energy-coupling factor transporter ATPase [Phascolarctobacterium sp.]
MQNLIEIKNLKHVYTDTDGNEIKALDGVSLSIARGEFVAVIGANGSGKSTLARHLNALLLPSEGKCIVAGMDTADADNLWKIRQHVGMVFQNPDNQIVAAIVEEDVAFGPENIGVPPKEIRTRVDNALAAVGMTEYARHAPHLLSGGQKQRVAIAGVLALEPDCIVLDEPTAMLDPRGRSEIVSTVKKLNREKKITVVYITHYMEEAMQADRIIAMEQGKIKMEGTPEEIFARVNELHAMGLETPVAAQVAFDLRQKGVKLPQGIISDERLTEELCR